jgi:hypothetical protein
MTARQITIEPVPHGCSLALIKEFGCSPYGKTGAARADSSHSIRAMAGTSDFSNEIVVHDDVTACTAMCNICTRALASRTHL